MRDHDDIDAATGEEYTREDMDELDGVEVDYMDGDAGSALASAGWGMDEDYGYYGDDG